MIPGTRWRYRISKDANSNCSAAAPINQFWLTARRIGVAEIDRITCDRRKRFGRLLQQAQVARGVAPPFDDPTGDRRAAPVQLALERAEYLERIVDVLLDPAAISLLVVNRVEQPCRLGFCACHRDCAESRLSIGARGS